MSAEIILDWGGGKHAFCLRIKQIGDLQKACNAGLGLIYQRLMSDLFYIEDITETIRFGLIGGGMPPVKAAEMISTFIDGQPIERIEDLSSPLKIAKAVIASAFFGIPEDKDDTPKKDSAATPERGESTLRPSSHRQDKASGGARKKRAALR
jgi:hypothetical protein